ncbi:phosphatase 2C-domain-containing protein [Lipomyces orientalis]|uniref:Phosphatase 2C-domain-containing protein n=1 Tax=Lipomyces orientalis TaxID=1233043 RepID=A0ACC3TPL9_9ASCO
MDFDSPSSIHRPPSSLSSLSRDKKKRGFLGKFIKRKESFDDSDRSGRISPASVSLTDFGDGSDSPSKILRYKQKHGKHDKPHVKGFSTPTNWGHKDGIFHAKHNDTAEASTSRKQSTASSISPTSMEANQHVFHLDTRLEDMTGILKPEFLQQYQDRKSSKRHLGKNRRLMAHRGGSNSPNGMKGQNAIQGPTSGPFPSPYALGPSSPSDRKASQGGPASTAWTAPDSWGVMRPDDELHTPLKQPQPKKAPVPRSKSASTYYVRVFRTDSTFATVVCPLDTTVNDLLQILGRKFFLPSVAHYQIGFRRLGLIRILQVNEHPIMLQKRILELCGYTDEDPIWEMGREDMGYLYRFLFIPSVSAVPIDGQEEEYLVGKKYAQVNLQRRNLQTIPASLYHHASEIVSLNLSENQSLDVPVQFIRSCEDLREIKFASNFRVQLPTSIMQAPKLNYLDISSNRLENLDNAQFEKHEALVSLKAQNNCLSSLPDSFAHLRNLRQLNLAFNYLTEFPLSVCNLVTLLELDVSFNEIRELPPEIGQLCALETFLITNNLLTGSLPETFQNLTSLKSLDIRYNDLTNVEVVLTLPRLEVFLSSHNSVSRLEQYSKRMRVLHLNQNPVTRFNFALPMITLTALNLANAKMSAFPEGFFEKITNLEKLTLDNNHFGVIPSQIGRLKRLTRFSCVGNSLSSLPPEIGTLTELRQIDVHSNTLSSLPSEIWQLSNLEMLNASSNNLDTFPLPLYLGSISSEASALRPIPSSEEVGRYGSDLSSRRSSNMSNSSGHSPRDMSGRRESEFSAASSDPGLANISSRKLSVLTAGTESVASRKDSAASSSRLANTMAQSIRYLYLADNQLNDDCLKEISFLTELVVLNLSYNYLSEIPVGTLGRLVRLRELYLSGNNLTNLPADDLVRITNLKIFHINANKLLTLPAELAEINQLLVLDVGSNSLKYNISNWPYDWNWNFNMELKYLNLSGNKRLEIKQSSQFRGEIDLSDFSSLSKLRVLGLMDVTLTNTSSPIPDQTEDRRVRTSGSEVHSMPYGMADTLGNYDHLSTIDMAVERFRGNEDEVIFGLFDGRPVADGGSKIAKFTQDNFADFFGMELRKLREGESVATALRRTFLSLNKELGTRTMSDVDDKYRLDFGHRGSSVVVVGPEDANTGACATVVYIAGNRLYVANIGDVRAVLSRTDREFRLLTKSHEPAFSPEIDRIREAGGWVSQTGKLNDVLEVSRSFGYFNLIPCVQAAPSIVECQLSDTDDLLIMATKELWEYIDYQTAVDMAATERSDTMRAAQKLRDFAIAYGCSDKIVVMIVAVGDFGKKISRSRVSGGVSLGSISNVEEEELFPGLKRRRARNFPEDVVLARSGGEVSPPVGELAMVFTDIKNSTLLWETYPIAMRSAIKIHNSIMRRQLRIVGGYEVKTEGDAFMVCFPTAAAAMVWCFSVQSQLLVAEWPSEITSSIDGAEVVDEHNNVIYRGLSVRMGIHWGSPVCERDPITRRMDYFGPMVNRASRISAVADGGQVTVSQDFVTEVYRLDNAYKKAPGDLNALNEVVGDEFLARAVDRDLKLLHGYGWDLTEVGVLKLKGLESPEFISLIYPKNLAARMKITASDVGVTSPAPQDISPTSEMIWKLRSISLRLERICSYLNGVPVLEQDQERYMEEIVGTNISDQGILPFMDHVVTRIENSISTLFIRSLNSNGLLTRDVGHGISDILAELSLLQADAFSKDRFPN